MPPADPNAQAGVNAQTSVSLGFVGDAGVRGGIGAIGRAEGPVTINNNYAAPPPPRAHNLSLKFLADRDEQERLIREHLARLRTSRRPIVFFAHGEPSQSLDGFVYKLGQETIRRTLRAINNTNQIECKPVIWPDSRTSDKKAAYRNNLSAALERSLGTPDEIVENVASFRRPVLLYSVHREGVDTDEEPGIREILNFWAELPVLRTELSLIIVVGMIYAEARTGGFLSRFRPQPKPSTLGQRLARFNGYLSDQLNVVVLPQLGDISLADAEQWVRFWLQPSDIEATLDGVRAAFGTTSTMPMSRLAPYLEKLAPKDREVMRQQ